MSVHVSDEPVVRALEHGDALARFVEREARSGGCGGLHVALREGLAHIGRKVLCVAAHEEERARVKGG